MYNTCSCSSTAADQHRSSDEISLVLHQIFLHSNNSTSSSSTSSSCYSFVAHSGPQTQSFAAPLSVSVHPHRSSGSMVGLDSGDRVNVGFFSENVRGRTLANASSLSIGGTTSENETDECDCESEEGLEALAEEIPAKPAPPRSSSKRSRAAEVHNLSEKRRRSRINEKMKALQNLIPNSNKTDKASMLDEAIEYLKQLQLQVQMLSMRNGISLRPMCVPGLLQIQLSQFNLEFHEESGPQHMNTTCSLPLNQENQEQIIFDLPMQCSVSNQLSVPNIINSETPFGVESSIQAHYGPFPLRISSELKEICREDVLPHHQLSVDHSERTRSELEMGVMDTTPLQFDARTSNLKGSSSLGTCMIGRDQSECIFLKNIEDNLIISPNLQGMRTERSTSIDEIKIERQGI